VTNTQLTAIILAVIGLFAGIAIRVVSRRKSSIKKRTTLQFGNKAGGDIVGGDQIRSGDKNAK
jgi:hypothetical protein